jgi:formylglycine-generating enzyme required for sulfatase activity
MEVQCEYAARGGLEGTSYPWGNTPEVHGRAVANSWQAGRFPLQDSEADGHAGTAPVGCYPANGFDLLDVVGKVWEWTRALWRDRHGPGEPQGNPHGGEAGGQRCAARHGAARDQWRVPPVRAGLLRALPSPSRQPQGPLLRT